MDSVSLRRRARAGIPLFALQELDGWESAEIVRRYAHLSEDHLARFAERLRALRAVNSKAHGTILAYPKKQRARLAASP